MGKQTIRVHVAKFYAVQRDAKVFPASWFVPLKIPPISPSVTRPVDKFLLTDGRKSPNLYGNEVNKLSESFGHFLISTLFFLATNHVTPEEKDKVR